MKPSTKSKKDMETKKEPISLSIDYPQELNRLTTFFRLFMIIPIAIILALITGSGETVTERIFLDEARNVIFTTHDTAGGLAVGLTVAVALMIIFRQRYPRWWFDFLRELTRFEIRVGAYALLLTDKYPSTEDEQSVHLEIQYPNVKTDLNRWLPLIKWFLAIPHYIVLAFLVIGCIFAVIISWFAILFTGKYPKSLFEYVVNVMRWGLRVSAYAYLLVTDNYPPFKLA